jgi:hypothetical protein
MRPTRALVLVKLVHTAVWAFFAGCILAIPAVALAHRFDLVAALTAFVLLEIAVLAVNRLRCPLTDVAARYTDERRDNFDVYLPLWLARYNKHVFGALFVAGELVAVWSWLR